jgi:hypothetical protein
VEISEAKLSEMIASVQAAGEEAGVIRRAMRVPVEGFARIQPLGSRQQRVVGVYDMSRTGIAIVDAEPIAVGGQFNVLFSRQDKRPIEVMCSARHSRREGEAFIIGAEFGVSWLSAVSAAMR